jgi:monoamine oxidase
MHDVVVIGAGLAGLAAARDLMRGRADVVVLEARGRPGGRVDQIVLDDGRPVQLGGELISEFHTAYIELAQELGLTTESSHTERSGKETTLLADGTVHVGDLLGWMDEADRASYAAAEAEFGKLVRTVNPDDPWSHPDAERLDRISVGAWLRSVGATPNVIRARELSSVALAGGSVERTSLLADLRKEAAAGSYRFYDYDAWESMRLVEGSATLAWRMAEELGGRIRYGSPVQAIEIGARHCAVTTSTGERLACEAVVCAIPAGPLRDVWISGVSEQRLASLRHQRHSLAAKAVFVYDESFWETNGQTGSSTKEIGILGGTWQQRPGLLSSLIGPERFAPLLATAPELVQDELVGEVTQLFGDEARDTRAVHLRYYGSDPYTKGYIAEWRPGDVLAVGRLHGTHEPPLYFCGSDHWVAGYMEGAVRTGRAAAAAALGQLTRDPNDSLLTETRQRAGMAHPATNGRATPSSQP